MHACRSTLEDPTVTSEAAYIINEQAHVGSLAAGMTADIAVFTHRSPNADAWADILTARPKDVLMTMVDGVILYGAPALDPILPTAAPCETIDVCGTPRRVCVATADTTNKKNQTLADIQSALQVAMTTIDGLRTDGYSFASVAPLVSCN